MDTKKLRQKILDLAIHGKLVPQDPNDEPASVLLERIRAEKERLIAEGKIKRSKKSATSDMSHYENVPFEVPDGWCWTTIGEVLTLRSGKNIKVRDCKSLGEYPIYGGNGINGTYNEYNVAPDTIIIGRVGFYCGSVNITRSKAWVTDNALIVSYIDVFEPRFLLYLLRYMNLGKTSNSTAQPVVSRKGILPLLIPIPPIKEQNRILLELDKLFDLVAVIEENTEDLEDNISHTKSKILDLAIHGKLVPQDPNDEPASILLDRIRAEKERLIAEGKIKRSEKSATSDTSHYENVPEGWVLTDVGELLINRDSERVPLSLGVRSKQKNKIYDYYGATGVVDKVDGYLFDERLLLIGEDGANLLSRSKDNAFFAEGKYWVNNHAHILDCPEKEVLDYVAFIINSMSLEDYITGSAQPKLNQDNLNKIEIPLPPLEEQSRIVEKVNEFFSQLDMIEKSLQA